MKGYYQSNWHSSDNVKNAYNPYNQSKIGTVPFFGPEVLDTVLAGLEKGHLDMLDLQREAHHKIFVTLLGILDRRKDELTGLIQIEQGKPLREARLEVQGAIQSVEVIAENPSLVGSEILPLAIEPSSRGGLGFTLRQPHGIVAILTPVVFPLLFPVIQVCYALSAGNSVLLKPAQTTPLIALTLVEMLLEAGLPPSAIACLPGTGRLLGKEICADNRLNYISCMGSIPTIRAVRHASTFVPTQLQWGCVSSVIVDHHTDLDRFTQIFSKAAFDNAGQSAFTVSSIAAVDSVYDELVDRLESIIRNIKVGNPLDPTTEMGPVTSVMSKRRYDCILESEKANGAEIVCGGTRDKRVIQPTLIRNCDMSKSTLSKKETSAPVIGISKIGNPLEAIEQLKHQRYHILSIFTENEAKTVNQAMTLAFENIYVNGIPTWRDGLVCVPGHPPRSGLRSSYDRVRDFTRCRDVVCINP